MNWGYLWRGLVLLVWMGLLAALLGRDFLVEELRLREDVALLEGRQTSFTGVYFQNERIGFVRSRLSPDPAGERLHLEQDAYLRLNILGEDHPVRLHLRAGLSPALELRDFEFSLLSRLAATEARGRIEGRELLLTLNTPRGEQQERIRLAAPPRIATPHRAYLLEPEPAVGSRLRLNYFDPVSLAGSDRILEYRGRDRQVIGGRVHNLHQFHETIAGMRISTWLDDSGRVIKEESPAGFVFLAEPEFRATDIPGAGPELLTAVAVPLRGRLPADFKERPELSLLLELDQNGPPAAELFPQLHLAGGRQHLTGNLLTIRREAWPPVAPDLAPEYDLAPYLAATPHIQSRASEIVALAAEITAQAADDAQKLRQLSAWVYQNLDKRPVLGIPDALSVLAGGVGDCNEHAVLLAALARAAGLPTRIAAGLLYLDGDFLYHAWNEIWLADQWLSVDATINRIPAPITHIRLVSGETRELVGIGAVIGRLQLVVPNHEATAGGR